MRKPCKNSRLVGEPRSVRLPSGGTVTEQAFEFTPAWGRTATEYPNGGFNPDMQTDQYEQRWVVPSEEKRRRLTDPRNPSCPLFRFIGNVQAKKIMQRAAFTAWGRENHCCADLSFAIVGPASAGKTTLARLFAQTVMLPFIEVPPKSIRNSNELFQAIAAKLEQTVVQLPEGPTSLKMVKPDPRYESDPTMVVPPCIVFIDEVHGLPKNLREELLKAVESKDRMLTIENGWYADCKNVCWVVATTERGQLFGPFDSRFTKVELDMYGVEEMALIVRLDNPEWDLDLCRVVAKYCNRLPREALDFAKAMKQERNLNGGTWEAVAARVAKSMKIDRYGLSRRRLNILVALGQVGPTSQGRLAHYAQCELEELVKFQMPALLIATPEDPALVTVTPRGYAITRRGLEELDRRGIPHRGEEVVAEGGQRLDFGSWNPDDFGTDDQVAETEYDDETEELPMPVAPAPPAKGGFLSAVENLIRSFGRK